MQKTSDVLWQDVQHQVLFDILDLIREPGSDAAVLLRLRDYTENHFALEERYMRVLRYPGRQEHERAHDQFRQEIGELVAQGEIDDAFREVIATFLTEWLKRHVFGTDKALENFILSSDLK